MYPNKSSTLVVHKDLINSRDFWRGMIDGDGCVNISKHTLTLSICGTKDICEKFKKFCSKYIKISTNICHKKEINNNNFYTFSICNKKAITMLDVLYKDSELFLIRKYNKKQEYLELRKQLDVSIAENKAKNIFKVYQYDIKGTFLKSYTSIEEARLQNNFSKNASLTSTKTYKGFIWKYHKENQPESDIVIPKDYFIKENSKFTYDEIILYRYLFKNGCSISEIAKKFNKCNSTIGRIVNYKLYKNII